jgi:hypothetical protein
MELAPIRETPEIAGKYLLKGLYATIRARENLPKNARIFDYAGSFPREKAPPSPGQVRHRAQCDFVIAALGETRDTMGDRFSDWAYPMFKIIDEATFLGGVIPPDGVRHRLSRLLWKCSDRSMRRCLGPGINRCPLFQNPSHRAAAAKMAPILLQ